MDTLISTDTDPIAVLRWSLGIDAAVTAINAVAYVAGAGALDSLLGVEAGTLLLLGVFLATYAA
ncbi:MAG: hypothetical protein ACRD0G_14360, partial [Acidimicrobiales bacterium]